MRNLGSRGRFPSGKNPKSSVSIWDGYKALREMFRDISIEDKKSPAKARPINASPKPKERRPDDDIKPSPGLWQPTLKSRETIEGEEPRPRPRLRKRIGDRLEKVADLFYQDEINNP